MSTNIHWIEIPTKNIERAKDFYCQLLHIEMTIMEAMGMNTAFFPHTDTGQAGGCLMQGPNYEPSSKGAIIYFNAGDDLQTVLDRATPSGGQIILPKTSLGKNGFMAHLLDTEGNKIGLFSKH